MKFRGWPQRGTPQRAAAALCLALLAACATTPAPLVIEPVASPLLLPVPGARAAAVQGSRAEREIIALADQAFARAPRPMKVISTEGRLPSDPVAQASSAAKEDWYFMLMLALAAQQDAPRYGPALQSYFAAWVAVFQPQFNPISEAQFHWLALAYEFGHRELTPATDASVVALFRRMAEGYLGPSRIGGSTLSNNWQSHRVKLAATLAFAINDANLVALSRAAFQKQLGDNIGADGAVIDFKQRDALHYVTYSLEPLLIAALLAQRHGENWYELQGGNGATLEQALRWLAPYASGKKQHEEFLHSGNAFDRRRAAAGVPGFNGPWNPHEALSCYQIAARLQSGWSPLALSLGTAPAWLELGFPVRATDWRGSSTP